MRKLKKIQIAISIIGAVALVNLYLSLHVDFGFGKSEDVDWLKIKKNDIYKNSSNLNEKRIRK